MKYLIKFMTFYAAFLLILSILWRFVPSFPIGHLPGDVTAAMGDLVIYFAFGTAFVLTATVTFILYIFQRF